MKRSTIVAASAAVLSKPERPPAREIREFREKLGMTQAAFAMEFNVPLGTLRRWEQERNPPRNTHSLIGLWRRLARDHRSKSDTAAGAASASAYTDSNQATEVHAGPVAKTDKALDTPNAPDKPSAKRRTILGFVLLPFVDPEILSCHHAVSCTATFLGS